MLGLVFSHAHKNYFFGRKVLFFVSLLNLWLFISRKTDFISSQITINHKQMIRSIFGY